jgi:hypothetical protein
MKNSIRTTVTRQRLGLVTAGLLSLAFLAQAQPTAHYVPGVEGIKGASLPPPGIYLRDYNVGYYSDRINDAHGNKVPVDAEVFVYANVPRLIWITDAKVLGGSIGVDALLPLKYTDLNKIADESAFGPADLFAEVTWSAHITKFDFSLAYGIWAPTGNSDTGLNPLPGSGYWTHMFTAGVTWYVDAAKKWAVSALNRYEINSEKDGANYTPGQAYTLEWGVSRAVSPTVDLGAIGYYQQQVTSDSNSNGARDRVAAVGPEVNVFYPRYKLGWSLRYAYEFMAENRLQGHTATLTLTKVF